MILIIIAALIYGLFGLFVAAYVVGEVWSRINRGYPVLSLNLFFWAWVSGLFFLACYLTALRGAS